MSATRIRDRHPAGTTRFGITRNRARALVVAPVLTAAVAGGLAMSAPANAASTWEGLKQCESNGNYAANTGNSYYGAFQFSLATWQSLGYSGLPSDASPAVQDEAAMRLAQRSGFGQWPVCGQGMGADDLAPGSQASRDGERSDLAVVPVSTPSGSHLFTTALVSQTRDDVRSWQAQMNTRGYHLAEDGRYGPASASAARDFQASHGLEVDGIVGPQTWAATFG